MGKKRKTKKEKIILNLKRQIAQQEQKETALAPSKKPLPKASFPPSKQEIKKEKTTLLIATQEIKQDLLKSFFLSVFAIGCLFLLYSR